MKLVLLKKQSEFAHSRFSRAFSTPLLRLRIAKSGQNVPRFGFIVPKKILPKASDRNKIKRRLKALAVKYQARLKSVDFLVFPQPKSLKVKFSELDSDITTAFKKLNVWKS